MDRDHRIFAPIAICSFFLLVACARGADTPAASQTLSPGEEAGAQPEPGWVYEFDGRSHSRPTLADGVVYVGRAGAFEGGSLLALDAAHGTLHWEFETTGHVPSSPTVADGVVYFTALDGFVYALDAATGQEKWRFDSEARTRSTTLLLDGALVFGSYHLGGGGGELFALAMTDGSLLWSLSTEGYFFESSPVAAGDHVLIGNTDGNVYAIDPAEGTVRWTFKAGDPSLRQHPLTNRREVLSSPAFSNGVVYVSSNDGWLYAFRKDNQQLIWKTEIGNSEGFSSIKYSISSPAVVGERVFVGSNNGKVFALDATDGSVQWEFQTGSWVWSTPAHDQGIVYVGSDDRHLYALEAASGELLWKYDTGPGALDREALSGIWGDPRAADGKVFVASQNGRIHALETGP